MYLNPVNLVYIFIKYYKVYFLPVLLITRSNEKNNVVQKLISYEVKKFMRSKKMCQEMLRIHTEVFKMVTSGDWN